VLVTGASHGIGRETALEYACTGATVAITTRSADALGETRLTTRDAIPAVAPQADAEVLVLPADVRDVEGARGAVRDVLECFGKLDILIANAGAVSAFSPREVTIPPPRLSPAPVSHLFLFI
jgi:NAD(P)-dependent dehydrogenase (short-subunit alcohol dehydrogenase family)